MQSPIQAAKYDRYPCNMRLQRRICRIPDTPRDSHELINRRIGVSANRNNGDLPVTIKTDPVGGEDMQRKSGRPRIAYAYVRSLHHIIPSTFFFFFFYLALRRPPRVSERNFIRTLFPRVIAIAFRHFVFPSTASPSGQAETKPEVSPPFPRATME